MKRLRSTLAGLAGLAIIAVVAFVTVPRESAAQNGSSGINFNKVFGVYVDGFLPVATAVQTLSADGMWASATTHMRYFGGEFADNGAGSTFVIRAATYSTTCNTGPILYAGSLAASAVAHDWKGPFGVDASLGLCADVTAGGGFRVSLYTATASN